MKPRRVAFASVVVVALVLISMCAGAETVLTVMDWKINETPQMQQWFQSVKEWFEADHPGVTVEYVTVGFGSAYEEKIITSVAAGQPPDVVSLSVMWARGLYNAGVLMPLNDLIAHTPELDSSQFVPVTQLYNQHEGVVYGITNAMDSAALIYNLDMFEEAGIHTDPYYLQTWDDFVSAAKKLTRTAADGTVTQYGYYAWAYPEIYNSWLVANGGSFYNEEQTRAMFTTPEALETARFFRDLNVVHGVVGGSLSRGTAAMSHGGNWTPYQLQGSAPRLRVNMTSYPQGPSGTSRGTTTWGNMMSIPRGAQNVDLAWEFVQYYAGLEGNIRMFEYMGYAASPRLDFYQTDVWRHAAAEHIWAPQIPELALVGGVYSFLEATKLSAEVWNPLMAPALNGETPIETAFEEAERIYNLILSGQ